MGFLRFLKRDKSKELDLELEAMEDLDMPPLPPDFKEKEVGMGKEFEGLPELPELPEEGEDISEIEEEKLPELELPEKPGPELKFPSMPELSEPAGKQSFPRYLEPTVPKPAGKQSFPRYLEPTVPKPKESADMPKPPPFPRPVFGIRQRPLFGWPKPEEQRTRVEAPMAAGTEAPKPRPEIRPYERFERAAVEEERAILNHKEATEPVYIRSDKFRDIITGTNTIKNSLKLANQSTAKLNEIDAARGRVLDKWKDAMIDLQKKLIFMDKTLFKR